MSRIPDPPLLVITDRKLAGGENRLLKIVEEALRGGCRWIMVREKDLPKEELTKLACGITGIAKDYGAAVVVNTDLEAAAKCNAAGVHLPWGLQIEEARRKIGREKLLGVSTHSLEEALEAERSGADYITLSPVFKPTSKQDTRKPLGLEKLREICLKVSIPVIALGGITEENASLCIEAGAAGVAVLGAVMASGNPKKTVEEIISRIKV